MAKRIPAREKLARKLQTIGRGARSNLARLLDCDPSRVTRFCTGELVPTTLERVKIGELYDIGILEWEDE